MNLADGTGRCGACLGRYTASVDCRCASGFDAGRVLLTLALGAVLMGKRDEARALFVALRAIDPDADIDEAAREYLEINPNE